MQKLEEVLKAEDTARHTVAAASERAKTVVRDAEVAAAQLIADERSSTAAETVVLESDALSKARLDADAIRAQGDTALNAQLASARDRMDDVVRRVVGELAG